MKRSGARAHAGSPLERSVRADQIDLLYRQTAPAILLGPPLGGLLCWALWDVGDRRRLALWLAVLIAAMLIRAALLVAYRRARPDAEAVLRWQTPYALSLLPALGAWGLGAVAVIPAHDPYGQIFTFFVLVGVAGGAAMSYSAFRWMATSAAVAVLLPSIVWAGMQPDATLRALAAGAAVFMTVSIGATHVLSGTLRRSFELTHALEAARRLADEHHRHFRFLAERAGDAIWTLSSDTTRIDDVSPAVRALLGMDPARLVGRPPESVMLRESLRRLRRAMREAEARCDESFRLEADFVHRDGHVVHAEIVATFHAGTHADADAIVVVTHDITDLKRDAESIRRLAFLDPLTELPNRRLLLDRLHQAIAHARRDGSRLGVLCVDLDGFKPVNDRHGHDAGDLVLRAVAQRLLRCIRRSDSAARVGGDEFIVLLPDLALAEDAGVAADKIRAALSEPFFTGLGRPVSIGASIGVAIHPDHGGDAWALLKAADEAMYRAKRRGGHAVETCGPAREPALAPGAMRLDLAFAYDSGDPSLDGEHRDLLVKASRLVRIAARAPDAANFLEACDRMIDSVEHHFAHEESALRARGARGIDEHARAHRRLLEQSRELRRRTAVHDVPPAEIADFLAVEVVGRHMFRDDRALGADRHR